MTNEWDFASMGPRPNGRGYAVGLVHVVDLPDLLQWGRDLTVADMWTMPMRRWPRGCSFNGAAT